MAVAAGTRNRLQSPRATAYSPLVCHCCEGPQVIVSSRVARATLLGVGVLCCTAVGSSGQGPGIRYERGIVLHVVRASMDGSGARLRASFVLAGHPPMSASIVLVRPGPAGFVVCLCHYHIFVQLFLSLKVRNVSYANQVLSVKRVNQRGVEGGTMYLKKIP